MCLSVLSPLVLSADLLLLFGGKVVCDVERLANLLGGLALNHVGNSLAADIKQGLDIKIVRGLDSSVSIHFIVSCIDGKGVPIRG